MHGGPSTFRQPSTIPWAGEKRFLGCPVHSNLVHLPLKLLQPQMTVALALMLELTNPFRRPSLNYTAHGVESKIIHNGRVYLVELRDLGPAKEGA